MTKQEADFIGSMNMCDEISNEAYKKIMCNCEVEEQQPCEDCISRQTVLRCIKESREGIDWGQSEDEDAFLHYSATLYRTIASKECFPPVQPQPKTGEWIEVEVCNCYATLKCSVCDRVIEPTFTYGEYSYDDIKEWYPYCHCGCRMNGGGEE